jgi:anti-sigma factor RsiW
MNGECRTYRDLMDSYISSELTVESNHELLRHIERCEACGAELERRERTRAVLRDSFGGAPDAAPLTARIAQALDREQHRRSTIGSVMRYGGIAAAIVLIAGASLWFSRPVDAAAYDDSVDDHIACALTYPPDTHYDAARAAQNLEPSYQSIVNAVSHKSGDYELIDAHMCPYQGRNYAHLVYRGDGRVLSVFAEASTRGRLPLTHETPRKGFVTAGRSNGGHQVFVVSDGGVRPPDSVVDDLMRATLAYTRSLEQERR